MQKRVFAGRALMVLGFTVSLVSVVMMEMSVRSTGGKPDHSSIAPFVRLSAAGMGLLAVGLLLHATNKKS